HLECTDCLDKLRIDLKRPKVSLVCLPEALERHALHSLYVEVRIDDHPLEGLKTAERAAKSLAVLAISNTTIKQILPQAGTHAAAPHANPVNHAHAEVETF